MKILGRWFILFLLVPLMGCGYHPMGAEPVGGPTRKTLAVPLFANRSTEVGLEAVLANALINTFAQTRAVKVTPYEDRDADLVLEGKVRSVDNTSVAFNDVTHSTVRRVTVRVELTPEETGKRQGHVEGYPGPAGRLRGGPQLPRRRGHQGRGHAPGRGQHGPQGHGQGIDGDLAVSFQQSAFSKRCRITGEVWGYGFGLNGLT